jgi:hypothetical protein
MTLLWQGGPVHPQMIAYVIPVTYCERRIVNNEERVRTNTVL